MGSKGELIDTNKEFIIVSSTACAAAIIIIVLVCLCMVNHCINSGKTHRRRSRSEKYKLYQNSTITRDRLVDDSLETNVNRPLPPLPEMNGQPARIPVIPEDDYLRPISVNSFWLKKVEEIRQLPPAPPVFPRQLERLLLDGEGAYAPVIPDDEAPLLLPGSMHEFTYNQQQCEDSEECGYMVPKWPIGTSLPQNVNETDHSPKQKEIKHKGREFQMKAMAVITPHEAEQQCPDKSKSRSLLEGSSISSATQNETENSKDTKDKIFRGTWQLCLSPPTQQRRLPVSTGTPTVVVDINNKT
jgi:hypothetical protein